MSASSTREVGRLFVGRIKGGRTYLKFRGAKGTRGECTGAGSMRATLTWGGPSSRSRCDFAQIQGC